MLKTTAAVPTTSDDFRQALARLTDANEQLMEQLRHADIVQAHTFSLPVLSKAEEKERRKQQLLARRNGDTFQAPPMPVQWQTGATAYQRAAQHWRTRYADIEDSTRFVPRLPGIVFAETDQPEGLLMAIEQVNTCKRTLQQVAQGLAKSADQRHEIIHTLEPGLVLIATIRQLPWFAPHHEQWEQPPQMRSVSFIWEHRYRSATYTRDEVLEQLERSMESGTQQTSIFYGAHAEGFRYFIEQEQAIMWRYPASAKFQMRRPLPATPTCVLRYQGSEDERSKVHNLVCHSPVLAINTPLPRKLMPLKDYPGHTPQPNTRKLVIERLYLYEKNT